MDNGLDDINSLTTFMIKKLILCKLTFNVNEKERFLEDFKTQSEQGYLTNLFGISKWFNIKLMMKLNLA